MTAARKDPLAAFRKKHGEKPVMPKAAAPAPEVRSSRKGDGDLWPRLLFFAEASGSRVPGELREILIFLRASGVEVSRVQETARFKLTQGEALRGAEWDEIRSECLAPHRDIIIELLEWCEHGGIPVRSKVLGGEIIWLTGDPTWIPDEAKRRAAYVPDEVEALAGAGPDEVKRLHVAKVEFGGGTVKDVSGHEMVPVTVEPEVKQAVMF